jgi:hypothetical protein
MNKKSVALELYSLYKIIFSHMNQKQNFRLQEISFLSPKFKGQKFFNEPIINFSKKKSENMGKCSREDDILKSSPKLSSLKPSPIGKKLSLNSVQKAEN